ncbi:hypothetical protein EOM60_04490 [Candidatus Saccharibacteria bacterium]|jgi:hypothetical protein|nr:hypothetical protein [Candidatus Saccharibacteria bacterium]
MSLDRYDTLFEHFIVNLALTSRQAELIDNKLSETLELFLREYDGDVDIYSQGSYAMGTTVRPLTEQQSVDGVAGEYDVDIALERTSWTGAKASLESMRQILTGEYGDKVDKKERPSCERVEHKLDENTGVGFHVDYVPIKQANGRNAAHRADDKWFPSDTKRLVEWFSDLSDDYKYLQSIIMVIKRARDSAGLNNAISSICITALVCNSYEERGSYAEDLLHVLDRIVRQISVPYSELSITLKPLEDDLADRITPESHKQMVDFLVGANQRLQEGFSEGNIEKIRSVLGSAFPSDIKEFPDNLEALRNRDWGIETGGSLKRVDISEHGNSGSFVTSVRKKFYGAGDRLIFHAQQRDKSEYGIRWQVLNAEGSKSRRGSLFKAKAPGGGENSNEFINHETEEYDGEHWIRYYIYSKESKKVVEIGNRFFVEVEA